MIRKLINWLFRRKVTVICRISPRGEYYYPIQGNRRGMIRVPRLVPLENGLGFTLEGEEPHTILGPGGDYNRPKFD